MPLQKVSSQRRALSLLKAPLPSCRLCCVVLLPAWLARSRGASSACQMRTLVFSKQVLAEYAVLHGHTRTSRRIHAPRAEGHTKHWTGELCAISAQRQSQGELQWLVEQRYSTEVKTQSELMFQE